MKAFAAPQQITKSLSSEKSKAKTVIYLFRLIEWIKCVTFLSTRLHNQISIHAFTVSAIYVPTVYKPLCVWPLCCYQQLKLNQWFTLPTFSETKENNECAQVAATASQWAMNKTTQSINRREIQRMRSFKSVLILPRTTAVEKQQQAKWFFD